MDISTSVFPSGHVGVAFSTALALLFSAPTRRGLFAIALAAAILVYLATVYGRYHYAMDGLASMAIVTLALRAGRRFFTAVPAGNATFTAKEATF